LAIAPRARRGTAGALLGYPENGPFTATPVRLGDTRKLLSDDSYGRGPIQRRLTYLRGSVHSGNSGGPVVDTVGRVMATVFASTTSAPSGGFAIPNGIVRAALGEASSPVDTGPCTG
jgi:S1-C subfamily serine protease